MTIVVQSSSSQSAASVATYSTLKKSIAAWLNRTDLADVIPDFVRMAEAEFARDVRIRSTFQTTVTDGYTEDGQIAVPVDLLELKTLQFEGSTLTELPLAAWKAKLSGPYFTRIGEVIHVLGYPSGTFTLTYVQKLAQLISDSDSNWLLLDHYDVYLWKCCEVGSVWMRDVEGVAGYNSKYEAAVDQLLSANNHHRWGGVDLQVQAPGVV